MIFKLSPLSLSLCVCVLQLSSPYHIYAFLHVAFVIVFFGLVFISFLKRGCLNPTGGNEIK